MKHKIFLAFAILLFAVSAGAADVRLAWDANTEPNVQYRIYAARYAQDYDYNTPLYDGAATSCTVIVDASAEYKFVARAYLVGASGQVYESGNSNQVVHAVVIWQNPNLRVE